MPCQYERGDAFIRDMPWQYERGDAFIRDMPWQYERGDAFIRDMPWHVPTINSYKLCRVTPWRDQLT
jgi:hypothetical protein